MDCFTSLKSDGPAAQIAALIRWTDIIYVHPLWMEAVTQIHVAIPAWALPSSSTDERAIHFYSH